MSLIIYAEDDELMAAIVRNTFATVGHVVGVVPDGRAALHSIKVKKPQLAILDCTIPEMSGIEVLREIRNTHGLFDLPVLMLTARSSEGDVDLAAFAGADAYVKKPFDHDYLIYVAENLIKHGRNGGQMAH